MGTDTRSEEQTQDCDKTRTQNRWGEQEWGKGEGGAETRIENDNKMRGQSGGCEGAWGRQMSNGWDTSKAIMVRGTTKQEDSGPKTVMRGVMFPQTTSRIR